MTKTKTSRALTRLTGILAAGGAITGLSVAPAHAETPGQYHLPTTGPVCIEDHGWKRWDDALPYIGYLLRTNRIASTVVLDSCAAYPDNRVITLATTVDDVNAYCARTERGAYVNGVATGRTTIRANLSSKWFSRCHATTGQRRHVMSHEVGHALGLVHNFDARSVMYAGASNPWLPWFTLPDFRDLHTIYDA